MQKRYLIYITLVALFIYAFYEIICIFFFKVKPGLPLDDVYIHLKYAQNFAGGYLFEYNKGEALPGSTSPLWVVMLSVFYLFTDNGILFSKILSASFHLLTSVVIFFVSLYILKHLKLLDEHDEKFRLKSSFLISAVFLFTGRTIWAGLSGMETILFSLLLVISIYYHIKLIGEKKLEINEFIALGLLSATRPEGYLISFIIFSDIILFYIINKDIKILFKKLIPGLLLYLLISLPYPVFSYFTTGSPFPTTFKAVNLDVGDYQSFNYIRIMSVYMFRDNMIIAVLYLINIFFMLFNIKKYVKDFSILRILNLILILYPLLSAIIFPIWRHQGRYLIPFIPLLILNSFITGLFLIQKINILRNKNRVAELSGLIIILFSLPYFLVFAKHYSQNIDNINEMQVKAGNWIRDNIKKNVRIGLNDIGAIQYIADTKITDLSGIMTSEIIKYRYLDYDGKADSIYNFLKKSDTKYLCIFDEWNVELVGKYKDKLKLIETFAIPNNITCGSDKMFIYKILY